MTLEAPKITIITVTYNIIQNGRENYFKRCIESVQKQTYPNIEHLIIDGASTDGTVDLIKKYSDAEIIKYISEPDKGVCDAMNKGIKLATGEYIAILNSDDYYENDAIEKYYNSLKNSEADYAISFVHLITKNDETYGYWNPDEKGMMLFFITVPFNHEAMLCHKNVYKKLAPNDYYFQYNEYKTAADCDFVNRLILSDLKYTIVNEPLLNFRMDGNTSPSSAIINDAQKKHISYFYKVYLELWKKYLSENTFNNINKHLAKKNTYLNEAETKEIFSIDFLLESVLFLATLKLKNYDYSKLIQYIKRNFEEKKEPSSTYKKKIYLFNKILFLKIKRKENILQIYLFGFIPIFKIQ